MALVFSHGTGESGPKVRPGKRLYLTAPKASGEARLVEEGDPDAYELYCTEYSEVPRAEFEAFGGKVAGAKESRGYEDKEAKPAADSKGEEWTLQLSPAEYLERYPDGPNSELARRLVGG